MELLHVLGNTWAAVAATALLPVYKLTDRDVVLIDTGYAKLDRAGLTSLIDANGWRLRAILCSHAHFDHILGVQTVKEKTGAKLVLHRDDLWLLKKENMGMFRQMAHGYVEPSVDIVAEEGTTVTFGGLTATYLHTPGHTPGSCCIRVGDTLFTGDTLFRHECGRCDLEGGSFSQMLDSLKRLHDLEGDFHVLPGHDRTSTLGEERRANRYMKQAVGR